MRRLVVLLVVATLLVPALVASADNGDGQEACNSGEICLSDLGTNERWRKHFWYNANYDGYQWWDSTDNHYEGAVRDDTSGVRNRDSVCDVRLTNDRIIDEHYTVANDGQLHSLVGVFDNVADWHTRVNC